MLPRPPDSLILSPSKLPVFKYPTITALDNLVKADVPVHKASSMYRC